jgi:hypothetical protein
MTLAPCSAFCLAFAALLFSAGASAAETYESACFCLENFDEARFLFNCHVKTPTEGNIATCEFPGRGTSEIVLSPSWTKLLPSEGPRCPKGCIPNNPRPPEDIPRGDSSESK